MDPPRCRGTQVRSTLEVKSAQPLPPSRLVCMAPELLARGWLRLDACYCGVAGAVALAARVPLARLFDVPAAVIASAGTVTVAWAWLLTRLARRREWRRPVSLVTAANASA